MEPICQVRCVASVCLCFSLCVGPQHPHFPVSISLPLCLVCLSVSPFVCLDMSLSVHLSTVGLSLVTRQQETRRRGGQGRSGRGSGGLEQGGGAGRQQDKTKERVPSGRCEGKLIFLVNSWQGESGCIVQFSKWHREDQECTELLTKYIYMFKKSLQYHKLNTVPSHSDFGYYTSNPNRPKVMRPRRTENAIKTLRLHLIKVSKLLL